MEQILKHDLLQDYYTVEQAKILQIKWSNIKEKMENEKPYKLKLNKIKLVAGVDISFPKNDDPKWGVACAVLWNYKKNEMIESQFSKGQLNFPYKAGFLGFRESKLIAKSILNLSKKPDVIMCDGHGMIHPRKFGEATHLGVALGIPSFGVAKNPYIGFSTWQSLKRERGENTEVWTINPDEATQDEINLLGEAVCLTSNCKPVFISAGFKLSLDNSIKIALDTTLNHRQPEPLLLADNLSRKEINRIIQEEQ